MSDWKFRYAWSHKSFLSLGHPHGWVKAPARGWYWVSVQPNEIAMLPCPGSFWNGLGLKIEYMFGRKIWP